MDRRNGGGGSTMGGKQIHMGKTKRDSEKQAR